MFYFNASFKFRQRFSFAKTGLKGRNSFFYNLHKTFSLLLVILPNTGFFPPKFALFSNTPAIFIFTSRPFQTWFLT